jgi:hypothetical protein
MAPATPIDRLKPYLADIRTVAEECGEDPYRLAGLVLRESEAGWAPTYEPKGTHLGWGDGGYAFGIIQADRRWHSRFIHSEAAQSVRGQLLYACSILRSDRRALKNSSARFDGDDAGKLLLERAAYAAYNAGFGAVYHAVLLGRDPDGPTAHHSYSADIFNRALALRRDAPDLFAPEAAT